MSLASAALEPKFSQALQLKPMYELVEGYRKRADMPHEALWAVIYIALVFGLLALGVSGAYDVNRGNQPSDQELATNFLVHEAAFDQLVQMLGSKSGARTMAGLDASTARFGTYERLLRQISVADFRYFPRSGKLILVPDGQDLEHPSKFYLYLPHDQPQTFVRHHGYYWRGPGVNILTGDQPLKASWYIRHEVTVEVAVTPY